MRKQANPDSWQRKPFVTGVPLQYHTSLSAQQFQLARLGVIPEVMEDKWFIYYEEPYLYFHRSWTGQPVYRLTFENREESGEVVEAIWSADLAQNSTTGSAYAAQLLDFLLYAIVLREPKEFPMPSSEAKEPKGLFQHHISGTAFPESAPKPKNE